MATSKSTRSPAFQFYPEAWFSSSKVQRMSHTERGMYMDLLGHCWLDHGLPADIKLLAAMLRTPLKRFERIWFNGPMHECFFERGGRLFNARLDREWRKQAEHRKHKQDAANTRWNRNAGALQGPSTLSNAGAMLSVSDRVSDRVSVKKEKESDTSPTMLVFPVTGSPANPTWALTEVRVAGWKTAYPHVDVLGECRKALVWVEANAPKTAKGMPAFLVRWLNTAANRGPRAVLASTGTDGRGRTGRPEAGKYAAIGEGGE